MNVKEFPEALHKLVKPRRPWMRWVLSATELFSSYPCHPRAHRMPDEAILQTFWTLLIQQAQPAGPVQQP